MQRGEQLRKCAEESIIRTIALLNLKIKKGIETYNDRYK